MAEEFTRGSALGPVDMQRLTGALDIIRAGFGMPYLVGSALTRRDPRDIDVRIMLDDDDPLLSNPERIAALNLAVSVYLRQATDLPVDFQFQSTAEGNAEPSARARHALFTSWWGRLDEQDRPAREADAKLAVLREVDDEIRSLLLDGHADDLTGDAALRAALAAEREIHDRLEAEFYPGEPIDEDDEPEVSA